MTRLIKLSPKKRFKALRKKQTHKRHDPSLGGLVDQSQQQYYDDDLTYDNIPFQSDIHDQSIKYVQDHNSTIDSLNETQFLFQFMNHNCRDKSPEIGKEGRKMATCLAWTYYNNSHSGKNSVILPWTAGCRYARRISPRKDRYEVRRSWSDLSCTVPWSGINFSQDKSCTPKQDKS